MAGFQIPASPQVGAPKATKAGTGTVAGSSEGDSSAGNYRCRKNLRSPDKGDRYAMP